MSLFLLALKKVFLEFKSLSNRALTFSLSTIIFQLILTPIIIILVTSKISPEEQGYYYTFLSLLNLQSFFELGLFAFIVNKASSSFSNITIFDVKSLNKSYTDIPKLAALYSMTRKIYFLISLLFAFFVGGLGIIFFSHGWTYNLNEIQVCWIVFCILCSFQVYFLGLNGFLEGCGQIDVVEKWKLISFVVSSMVLIVCLVLGFGIMSLVFSTIPKVLKDIYLIKISFRKQFKLLSKQKQYEKLNFYKDVWPMQSRLAISSFASFFQYGIFVPLVFSILGPVQAGIIGVGLQITSFLQQIMSRWTYTQQPKMAKLASLRKFQELDKLVQIIGRINILLSVFVLFLYFIFYKILEILNLSILERIPGFWVLFILLLTACNYGYLFMLVGYLRAFVEERIHILSVTIAVLNAILCYAFLKHIGLYSVAISYFACITLVGIPWAKKLIMKKRRELAY